MEFKEGDKVMGIHTDLGYVGLVCGKIIQVERIVGFNIPAKYIVEGEETKFDGVLNTYEAVEFSDFKFRQIKIFWEERERLLDIAELKMKRITNLLKEADITK